MKSPRRDRGYSCPLISHDLAAVEEIANRVVVMPRGRIVEDCTRDAVLNALQHAYT